MPKLKWTFVPNAPQIHEGLHHSGLMSFRGHRSSSLARELIQNSLDAVADPKKPVKVQVSLRDDIEFGREELSDTFDQCAKALIGEEGDDLQQIERGRQTLKNRRIRSLVVEDYNTVGLAGRRLGMLIKGDAASFKARRTSLGNRGIGKNAAFAVSSLYTVLYSSQFVDEDTNTMKRAFQGKSSLVSHLDISGEPRGRTGYYGVNEWSPFVERAVSRSGIPENVRRSENGTNIIIVGFDGEDDWEGKLTTDIISNFYFAILDKKLEVEITDEKRVTRAINNTTIAELFNSLSDPDDANDPASVAREHFWCIADPADPTTLGPPTQSGQLDILGHCKVWIKVEDGLPRRVEVVRNPGMLICNGVGKFPGLQRLRGYWSDFVAVVVCESDAGNDLLKRMEPPDHNDFQPELLDDPDDRTRGELALRELGNKVREWLDYKMPLPESEAPQPVDELTEFFPSEDESTGGGGEEEDPFGAVKVGQTRERPPVPTRRPPEFVAGEPWERDEDDEGGEGTRRRRRRRGTNESEDGQNQVRRRNRSIRVSDVRFAPPDGNEVKIWFTANESVSAGRLAIHIGSEERANDDKINVCTLRDGAGNTIDQGEIEASPGERVSFTVITEEPFPANRSLVVNVTTELADKA